MNEHEQEIMLVVCFQTIHLSGKFLNQRTQTKVLLGLGQFVLSHNIFIL